MTMAAATRWQAASVKEVAMSKSGLSFGMATKSGTTESARSTSVVTMNVERGRRALRERELQRLALFG